MKSGRKKIHETFPNAAFLISFFPTPCFASLRQPSPYSRDIYCLGLGPPHTSTQKAITDSFNNCTVYWQAMQYQNVWVLVAYVLELPRLTLGQRTDGPASFKLSPVLKTHGSKTRIMPTSHSTANVSNTK